MSIVPERKRTIWIRLLPPVIGAGLLYAVLRGLPLHLLKETLGRMRVGWFLAAVLLYGLIFVPAAWRWHLVLKLSQTAISFRHTLRASVIGHFFYTLCFGVLGGDSAKAVLYAQRFGFSPTSILSTAPLDRLLGLIGSTLFTVLALLIGLFAGGFTSWEGFTTRWRGPGLAIASGFIVVGALLARRALLLPAVARFWALLAINFRLLRRSPRTLASGFLCGFLVQVALTAALGANLAAVASIPIAWQQILWTFPFVIAISALPISIGGIGTRESAAVVLWSAYAIPRTDAIAASLLTLTAALFWAGVGGLLLLLDENKRRAGGWRAVSKGDAGFPQKIQSSQSGKLIAPIQPLI